MCLLVALQLGSRCTPACFGSSGMACVREPKIQQVVEKELKDILFGLRKTAKRKACPTRSVPNEVLLMALDPGYCSVRETDRRGLGHERLTTLEPDQYMGCNRQLKAFLHHLHACTLVPLIANRSKAFLQPKSNGRRGLLGQRILHVYCPFWKQ